MITKDRIPNRKKKTSRWCKGKVGVEHTPAVVSIAFMNNLPYYREGDTVLLCSKCQKILERNYCGNCKESKMIFEVELFNGKIQGLVCPKCGVVR